MTRKALYQDDAMELRLCWYAPGSRMAPHAHAAHQVSWLLAGEMHEADGARVRELTRPSLGVKGAGFRHANHYGPDGALILSLNLDPGFPLDDRSRSLDDWRWSAGEGVNAGAAALARCVQGGGSEARDAAWDLLALATGPDHRSRAGAKRDAPDWLRRAKERLASPDERVDIAALAKEEGLHRVYFSRRFRETFGLSPTLYRRACRLARAVTALARGRAAAQAALGAGFADQAHFGRVARAALGLTPGQLMRVLAR